MAYERGDVFAKQTPLPELSGEYGKVEYSLQLALQSTSAHIRNIFAIGNPNLNMNFEKRCAGLLTLYTWVDTSMIGDGNTVDEVCGRGFRFNPQGMVFAVGNIYVNPGRPGKRPYEYMLCRISVGRSYVLDAHLLDSTRPGLPEGYDSIYLHKPTDQRVDEETGTMPYHHEYLIFDPAQVLPVFLVQFDYDPEEEKTKKVPMCQVCEEEDAVVYCYADDARLCAECDAEIHSANKLVQKHRREPLREVAAFFGNCLYHPATNVEYFCPVCHIPVCVHCKMVGNHASGEASLHKLVTVKDAYGAALDAANKEDPALGGRKQKIVSLLSNVDSSLKAVNQNSSAVEAQLYQLLQDALFQLQSQTQAKLGVLLSTELELRRQMEEMEWMERYLGYQQKILKPTIFLNSWHKHALLRSEMSELNADVLRQQVDVRPDLSAVGKLQVISQGILDDGRSGEPGMAYEDVAELRNQYAANASTRFRASLFRDDAGQVGPGEYDPEQYTPQRPYMGSVQEAPPGRPYAKKTADIWADALTKRGGGQ